MDGVRSALHLLWMVLTVVPWTLAVVVRRALGGPVAAWWAAVHWFGVVMWGTRALLGVQMQVRGREHLPRDGRAVVFLVKHQSTLETLWLPTVVGVPLAFVFKRELLRIPFFGWSMACLDMIHIDRAARAVAMKQVIDNGKRLLGAGTSVALFPEGTRMPRGQAGTYQTAGTRLAVEAGVDIIPVAVATARVWPREGWVKQPGLAVLSFGPPMPAAGGDARALMRQAQAWIEAEMRRIDPDAYAASGAAGG